MPQLHQLAPGGIVQRQLRPARVDTHRSRDLVDRRSRRQRGREQQILGVSRERFQRAVEQLPHIRRDQWQVARCQCSVPLQRVGHRQRNKRIAARHRGHAFELTRRDRLAVAICHDPHDLLVGERHDVHRFKRQTGGRQQVAHPIDAARPGGQQQPDRFVPQPPNREGERARRRSVEPVAVVDRDHDRSRQRQVPQHRQHTCAHRMLVDAMGRRLAQPKSGLQRAALRVGQGRAVERPLQQVAEAGEREVRLGLAGLALEHPVARAGPLDRFPPDGGLADPGLADQQQHRRPAGDRLEHDPRPLELPSPAGEQPVHRPIMAAARRAHMPRQRQPLALRVPCLSICLNCPGAGALREFAEWFHRPTRSSRSCALASTTQREPQVGPGGGPCSWPLPCWQSLPSGPSRWRSAFDSRHDHGACAVPLDQIVDSSVIDAGLKFRVRPWFHHGSSP